MKLLVDTNAFLDFILERKDLMRESAAVLDAIEDRRAKGYVSSHALTTIHYIVAKANGRAAAATAISDVLDLCEVVAVNEADFHRALAIGLKDFKHAPFDVRSATTVAILLSVPDSP